MSLLSKVPVIPIAIAKKQQGSKFERAANFFLLKKDADTCKLNKYIANSENLDKNLHSEEEV